MNLWQFLTRRWRRPHVAVRAIGFLPDGERAISMAHFRGRLLVTCDSGYIYELRPELGPNGEEYTMCCHGFVVDWRT